MGNNSRDLYIIIFCDLVNSSEVAAELSPDDYANNYIKSFYFTGLTALNYMKKKYTKTWMDTHSRLVGDEIVVFMRIKDIDNPIDEVRQAVTFVYTLKLYWLFSPYIIERVIKNKMPREISCGIHVGHISKIIPNINFKGEVNFGKYASYEINVAKRVESYSRKGNTSYIFATHYISSHFSSWQKKHMNENRLKKDRNNLQLLGCVDFDAPLSVELKGVASNIDIAELNSRAEGCDHILRDFLDLDESFSSVKTMIFWFENISKQNNKNNAFIPEKKDRYYFNKFIYNTTELDKYISCLNFLTKCSANIWFHFNILYITQALKKNVLIVKRINKHDNMLRKIAENFSRLLDRIQRDLYHGSL